MATLKSGDWANDELAKRMTANPVLAEAMRDPRMGAVLQALQADPTGAMAKFGGDPKMKAKQRAARRRMVGPFAARRISPNRFYRPPTGPQSRFESPRGGAVASIAASYHPGDSSG